MPVFRTSGTEHELLFERIPGHFEGVVLHPNRIVTLHARADDRENRLAYVLSYEELRVQIGVNNSVTGLIEPPMLASLDI